MRCFLCLTATTSDVHDYTPPLPFANPHFSACCLKLNHTGSQLHMARTTPVHWTGQLLDIEEEGYDQFSPPPQNSPNSGFICRGYPPPPLSFPTPGMTVPHHPRGNRTTTVHAHLQAQKLQHKTKELSMICSKGCQYTETYSLTSSV